jgi:5-hydroxyisourate hydrolase
MKMVTQILDSVYGKSAAGVRVRLARATHDGWTTISDARTNTDGCIDELSAIPLVRGVYRMAFETGNYFAGLGEVSAFSEIAVVFRVADEPPAAEILLTLSPYSYSVYFDGSNGTPKGVYQS